MRSHRIKRAKPYPPEHDICPRPRPYQPYRPPSDRSPIPVSVNYFPHRQCNYACVFCFHTNLSSTRLSLPRAQEGLRMLAAAGMKKLNISGGEPFLHAQFLGKLLRFAKEELQLEGTGVICNGSLVTQAWIDEYGDYLDFMGVSCDSFDEETNEAIGRRDGRGRQGMHWRKVHPHDTLGNAC
ncbi:hypothetical protein EVG20_g10455 [Dentipellis fragilis]|uniref:Radical SAM core domain-containing protein n=1 Tax=Dentipellis fragilis TaxID=205917 RepID=A0A4Y9XTF3_9AGAM|nr:hypothetical protein EVG20_g10455 [Dentipellis fragilis]